MCAINGANDICKVRVKFRTVEDFRGGWSISLRKLNIGRVDRMGGECDKGSLEISGKKSASLGCESQ